jgi:hypothetical protein
VAAATEPTVELNAQMVAGFVAPPSASGISLSTHERPVQDAAAFTSDHPEFLSKHVGCTIRRTLSGLKFQVCLPVSGLCVSALIPSTRAASSK